MSKQTRVTHKEIRDKNKLLEKFLETPQNSRVTFKAENRGTGETTYKI